MTYGQLKILTIWGTFSEDVDKRSDVIDLLEICSFKVCGTKYVKGTLEFFYKVLLTHFMLDEWNRYHNSSVLRKLSPIGKLEKALWLGLSPQLSIGYGFQKLGIFGKLDNYKWQFLSSFDFEVISEVISNLKKITQKHEFCIWQLLMVTWSYTRYFSGGRLKLMFSFVQKRP